MPIKSKYLFVASMDVDPAKEALFNEVYDTEHLPRLKAVPGVIRAARYRQPSPTEPRYLAAYELESVAVLQTPEWRAAGEAGRWPKEIRPRTMNRHLATYEWVGSSPALTYRTPYVFWVMMDIEPHRDATRSDRRRSPVGRQADWRSRAAVRDAAASRDLSRAP